MNQEKFLSTLHFLRKIESSIFPKNNKSNKFLLFYFFITNISKKQTKFRQLFIFHKALTKFIPFFKLDNRRGPIDVSVSSWILSFSSLPLRRPLAY